ncbi:MAG: TlyA family RNA methyltransferase [Acidobacteriota bacterium]|jgi:23S rRNA (cytidine1920-2'-O)/16S rRNA (cytidine1409-2'-O)-methyltransferase
MASTRRRIDQLLVDRGLAESRHKAQALLLAGQVLVNEQRVEKSGRLVDPDAGIRILSEMPFVSRAGAKLQAALDFFGVAVAGRVCADLGASTGGFTDCLLQNGAADVHAYDVGTTQLVWKLRSDPRVVIHERCNVRYLEAQDLPDQLSLLTIDLSFISLTKVLLPLKDALQSKMAERNRGSEGACVDLIVLVKPQFEVGKGEVGKGGIVRDATKQRGAVIGIRKFAADAGFDVRGDFPSPVPGAKGNREFLLHLQFVPV